MSKQGLVALKTRAMIVKVGIMAGSTFGDDPYKVSNCLPISKSLAREFEPYVQRLRHLVSEAKRSTESMTPVASANLSVADELKKFATLRDEGILSDEEFETAKARLLAGNS